MMNESLAEQIFDECDTEKRGYLEKEDLAKACPQLNDEEREYIFRRLDRNQDGQISRSELISGLESALAAGERTGFKGLSRRASSSVNSCTNTSPPPTTSSTTFKSTSAMSTNSTISRGEGGPDVQEEVLNLYGQLQQAGTSDLLSTFEKVVGTFFKEIKDQKEQNERLQQIYSKEKEEHSKHLTEVETELDQQVSAATERARQLEREKLEKEKETMRERLESEIQELNSNIKRLQKMETSLADGNDKSSKLNEMKSELTDLNSENRALRSNLTAKQTEMALIKAQLAQLRQEFNEKCGDLKTEKETLISYMQEQDNLTQQLQLLCDANTKLHDTNDTLRSTLTSHQAVYRALNMRSPSPITPPGSSNHSRQASVASTVGSNRLQKMSTPNLLRLAGTQWTTKDSNEHETDDDSGLARMSDGEMINLRRSDGFDSEFSSLEEGDSPYHQRATMSDQEIRARMSSVSSAATVTSPTGAGGTGRMMNNNTSSSNLRAINNETNGHPERTFRVVLAGDASVGKSSLIMRLVKDAFLPNLQSTLGVDFHVKVLNVDGRKVAIQLWDTAGQERFRSLCKSYFRRADGAFLVYDSTSEQSFLNVRNWMAVIEESVPRPIPILLCGNKVDLRIRAASEKKRTVSREEGEKLAKNYNALFMETSAKEGTNVHEACIQLARELLATEDVEVKSTSLILKKPTPKSSSCCSK